MPLPPIPTPMVQCLFPSSSEVIRPQFQLLPVTPNTGRFICQSETSITTWGVHIEMALFSLVFSQFLKVSVNNSVLHTTYTYAYISREKICRWWQLSQLSAPITSYISCEDPWLAQTGHDNAGSSTLPRWTLSTRHIRTRTVHRRLPWTVPSSLYRARLVSKVNLVVHKSAWSGLNEITEGVLHLHAILMEMRQDDVKRIQSCS